MLDESQLNTEGKELSLQIIELSGRTVVLLVLFSLHLIDQRIGYRCTLVQGHPAWSV